MKTQAHTMPVPGPRPCRWGHWAWVAAAGVLVGMALLVLWNLTTPKPLNVDTAGFDPAISEAIARARQAVSGSPRSAQAWGHLGMVLLAHEVQEPAEQSFRQAILLAPDDPRWPYYLGLAQLADNPMAAASHLGRAVHLASASSPGAPPNGHAPRLRLAETLLNLGRVEEAEAHFQEVWRRDPGSAHAALGLGMVARTRDQSSEAAEFLSKATRDRSTRKSAYRLLVSVYQRLHRTNEVDQAFRILSGLPNDEALPDAWFEDVERLKVGENVWIDRADAWIKSGRVVEAAQLLEQTLQAYPNSDRAMFFLGRARHRLGDLDRAEAVLARAIAVSPGKVEAQVQLGVIRLARGRDKEAQRCFREAIQIKPNLAEAWYNLGLSLGRENPMASMTAFREAIRLKPNLFEAYLGLAVVLRADRQIEEAAEMLKRALTLDPEGPIRQKLLDQLRVLESP